MFINENGTIYHKYDVNGNKIKACVGGEFKTVVENEGTENEVVKNYKFNLETGEYEEVITAQ